MVSFHQGLASAYLLCVLGKIRVNYVKRHQIAIQRGALL